MTRNATPLRYWEIRCKGFAEPCPTLGPMSALSRKDANETSADAVTRALGLGNPDLDCGPHTAVAVADPPSTYMSLNELRDELGI